MITGLALVCLNVTDLDEAKRFYVDVLGLEVGIDQTMDGQRWLTVHAADGARAADHAGGARAAAGGGADRRTAAHPDRARLPRASGPCATDDCRRTYAELAAKGVEMTEEPEERFYGIDAGFRDPFGNHWRLTEPRNLAEIRSVTTADGG